MYTRATWYMLVGFDREMDLYIKDFNLKEKRRFNLSLFKKIKSRT